MSSKEEIENIDYSFPNIGKMKIVLIVIGLISIFIFSTFPISKTIDHSIKSAMGSIPGCKLSYKSINYELFLPKIIVNNLKIPGTCLDGSSSPIILKKVDLLFKGFSFSPFGPSFTLETKLLENPISANIAAGLSEAVINIKDNTIDISNLEQFVPLLKLNGNFLINSLIRFDYQNLSDLKLVIQSKNFSFPSQNIMGFKLPVVNLNNFYLKADMGKNNNIKISDIIIGDTDASIRANFKGSLRPNLSIPLQSYLDIKGELAFSKEFIEKIPFIETFMIGLTKKDDFYQIIKKGTIQSLLYPN